jgi:hypothetical protein
VAWDTWDSIGGLHEAEKQARVRIPLFPAEILKPVLLIIYSKTPRYLF